MMKSLMSWQGQINIREDLIEKELQRGMRKGTEFHKIKLSNRFVDWIFRKFYTVEFCINFYDREPDWNENYEDEDAMPTYEEYRAFEEQRMAQLSWQDPFGEGIWGWSQKTVDSYSKKMLKGIKDYNIKKKDRLYCGTDKDYFYVYWYGRDCYGIDYWWIMKRRS